MDTSSTLSIGATKENRYEVDCKKFKDFPTFEIKLGQKKLSLGPHYYIKQTKEKDADVCYSRLKPHASPVWTFGAPFLEKYYIAFNNKGNPPEINFYESV